MLLAEAADPFPIHGFSYPIAFVARVNWREIALHLRVYELLAALAPVEGATERAVAFAAALAPELTADLPRWRAEVRSLGDAAAAFRCDAWPSREEDLLALHLESRPSLERWPVFL